MTLSQFTKQVPPPGISGPGSSCRGLDHDIFISEISNQVFSENVLVPSHREAGAGDLDMAVSGAN